MKTITEYRTATYDEITGIIGSNTLNESDPDMLHELNETPYRVVESELIGWNADALIYCEHETTPGYYLVRFS